MATLRYFAYGSNMLHERLYARVPTAVPVATGTLPNHCLDFAKVSNDGSGKGDVVDSPGNAVWGVLYEVADEQLANLDRNEGPHYRRDDVGIVVAGAMQWASVYRARPDHRDPAKLPYDWYLALVIAGARQNGLPEDYIDALASKPRMPDREASRRTRLEALDALAEAGMMQVLESIQHRSPLGTGDGDGNRD